MYETTFGFTARPFSAAPQSICYYDSGPVESARKTIIECIERAEGPALLVGPPGVGKSLVCHKIAEHFDKQFRVVLLTDARIGSRKELLQNILFDLGLSYQDIDEGELRLSLIDFLDPHDSPTSGMLLIIDEADTLSVELLEEIRMITNLVRDGQPRVRLLLSGGPELETLFANPKLETFNQRIARRCYLHNLSEQQTAEYVRAQISGVGGDAHQVFTDDAIASIFIASDGSPRFVNQLCDHALLLNSVSGFDSVNAEAISEAWSDLQQLPAPWDDEPEEPAPSFIEFGELSDDSQGSAQPESNTEATPPVGDSALNQLDAIQQEVDRIVEHEAQPSEEQPSAEQSSDEQASDEQPVATETTASIEAPESIEAPTPAEAIQNVDPFGDDFEEEEAVIDPHTAAARQAPLTEATPAEEAHVESANDEAAFNEEPHDEPATSEAVHDEAANEVVEAEPQAEQFEAATRLTDIPTPIESQWDEPTDIELESDPSDEEMSEVTSESEVTPQNRNEASEEAESAEEHAADAYQTEEAESSDADHQPKATEPIELIGSSLSFEEPASQEEPADVSNDLAEAAAESDTPQPALTDDVSAQHEPCDEASTAVDECQSEVSAEDSEEVATNESPADELAENLAASEPTDASFAVDEGSDESEASVSHIDANSEEPASFDEADHEQDSESAVHEDIPQATDEPVSTPMQTMQLNADAMPMMGLNPDDAASSLLDADSSDEEPQSNNEITPAAESAPMHTVQLDSEAISQSIEASREEIFSIDTDSDPPAPHGSNEPANDEFFLIDSEESEASIAEPPSDEMFSVDDDEPKAAPGEWPLAGPIDEQVEAIDEQVEPINETEEHDLYATEATFRAPAAESAEMEPEAAQAEVEPDPQVLDDRDMIVVEEPQEDVVAEEDLPRARRQEYRQLFARLRKSQ